MPTPGSRQFPTNASSQALAIGAPPRLGEPFGVIPGCEAHRQKPFRSLPGKNLSPFTE
jgi:hypothetical protein